MLEEIDIFKVLDYIRDNAKKYAKAKAMRIYLEEFRKSKKALLMRQANIDGVQAVNAQEVSAYASPEYMQLLLGLKEAVEEEEGLRWMLIAAQAKAEAWRTISANQRVEAKVL